MVTAHCYQLREEARQKKRMGREDKNKTTDSFRKLRGSFGADLVMIKSLAQEISGCGLMFGAVIKLAINSLKVHYMCWLRCLFTSLLVLSRVQRFTAPRTVAHQVPL